MLKGKLKFPDRPGSLFAGFEGKVEESGLSGLVFEFGEELEIVKHSELGLGLGSGSGRDCEAINDVDPYEEKTKMHEKLEFHEWQRPSKDGFRSGSVIGSIVADEKRSDLEYEFCQKEINLEKLQRIAGTGLPEEGGLRAAAWKLLLGYLPPSRDLWEKELTENRQKYAKLKKEHLSSPSELSRNAEGEMNSNEQNSDADVDGLLRRHKTSQEDHPLSLGKASVWYQYFQHTEILEQIQRDLQRTHPDINFFSGDSPYSKKNREAMQSILLLFAKLNPDIRYVQGMNEVLSPIFHVFSTDTDEENAANAEADSFCCFVRLLSVSVDHFCPQLDNSSVGILSTLSRLSDLLKANDEVLWHHLEFTSKVKPQYFGFRWITLLLTQEFKFQSILRIWDSLLSNPFGVQDMLLRVCCAMLLCLKSRLLAGDFAANMKLLQHYPDINIEHLLLVARDLNPDMSSYP